MLLSYLLIACLTISSSALAIDEYILILKDHHFIPEKIYIPAYTKIKLIIDNQDNEVEEFESFALHREKIVPALSKIKINIGPIDPGEYKFFGDFHTKTAQGVIIAE